eukprot:357241-Chlamydomonas_euryale.AAC.11
MPPRYGMCMHSDCRMQPLTRKTGWSQLMVPPCMPVAGCAVCLLPGAIVCADTAQFEWRRSCGHWTCAAKKLDRPIADIPHHDGQIGGTVSHAAIRSPAC